MSIECTTLTSFASQNLIRPCLGLLIEWQIRLNSRLVVGSGQFSAGPSARPGQTGHIHLQVVLVNNR